VRRRLTFDDQPSRRRNEEPIDAVKLPFDPWRFFASIKRRWYWLIFGMLIVGGLACAAGNKLFKYKVGVYLIRNLITDPMNPNPQDPTRQQLSDQTLFSFMRSGEVLRRVSSAAATNIPPINIDTEHLARAVSVTPTANPDILMLAVSGTHRSSALADIANIYAEQVVH